MLAVDLGERSSPRFTPASNLDGPIILVSDSQYTKLALRTVYGLKLRFDILVFVFLRAVVPYGKDALRPECIGDRICIVRRRLASLLIERALISNGIVVSIVEVDPRCGNDDLSRCRPSVDRSPEANVLSHSKLNG